MPIHPWCVRVASGMAAWQSSADVLEMLFQPNLHVPETVLLIHLALLIHLVLLADTSLAAIVLPGPISE